MSSSDYSPSAPLDRSSASPGYPAGSPGYPGGSPGYPGGSPGYPGAVYPGAGHGSLPPGQHQPAGPPTGPGPGWLPATHGGPGPAGLTGAVGGPQLR